MSTGCVYNIKIIVWSHGFMAHHKTVCYKNRPGRFQKQSVSFTFVMNSAFPLLLIVSLVIIGSASACFDFCPIECTANVSFLPGPQLTKTDSTRDAMSGFVRLPSTVSVMSVTVSKRQLLSQHCKQPETPRGHHCSSPEHFGSLDIISSK